MGNDNILDLIEVVTSIYTFCNDLNDSFIRYKNHAKYLNELALQLDSIYKLSENKKLLSEKGDGHLKKKKKDKNKKEIFENYKKDLEGDIPPVIINFYNYTKKFVAHVKKVKKKNFVERLWYISVNDEKMDGLEEELNFIMKQFQIDTFTLLHSYVKEQKDTNNREVPALPQSQSQSQSQLQKDTNNREIPVTSQSQTQNQTQSISVRDRSEDTDKNNNDDDEKMKKKEKEMKKIQKEMQKREYELIKEVERLRSQNEKERKKRRELEKMKEYQYYNDILENDEKLYKKMLVRVPVSNVSTPTTPIAPTTIISNSNMNKNTLPRTKTTPSFVEVARAISRSQTLNNIDSLESSPLIMKNKKNLGESNNTQEKNMPYMTDNQEESNKTNANNGTKQRSAIIDVFKKNEYEYIVKTMNMVNHSQANPKLYNLAIKLLGYMKRKSKVANETKALPFWFVDETNMDVLEDKNAFIGSGSYCYVQKCIYNGALVAKKTLNVDPSEYNELDINTPGGTNYASYTERDWFLREIEIWSKIKSHPNVLQFYGACHISQHPSIISEYCSQGTVKSYTSQKKISPEQKLKIMHGIVTGLYHLHQNNIIHGDLKSDNILIAENGTPKICDFGLSVIKTEKFSRLINNKEETNNFNKLTTVCKITDAVRWKAPELFPEYKLKNIKTFFKNNNNDDEDNNDDSNYNEEDNDILSPTTDDEYKDIIGKISIFSDIFSMGRLFYEIIFQKIPFYDIINEVQVEYLIIHNKYPSKFKISSSALERNILYSSKMWDIMEKTWKYDPLDRISLMNIATLLIQLRNQQLQINHELKESSNVTTSKQNISDEMEMCSSIECLPNNNNLEYTINNRLSKKSSRQSHEMKHSISTNCIDIISRSHYDDKDDSNLDNFNPDRGHRRSISNVETSLPIQNLIMKCSNGTEDQDELKQKNLTKSLNSGRRIPKNIKTENYHTNSSQIVNNKVNSLERSNKDLKITKSNNDLVPGIATSTADEKSHHSSSKSEISKLCIRIESLLENNNTIINLDKEGISGKIPEEIENYKTITELCLAYNKIKGSIPNSIGSLSNLTILRLHGNNLSGKIPESISQLRNLVELRLDHNSLSDELPSSIGNLKKLTHLYLSHNKLTGKIPEKLGNLKNLVHLIMQDNQFSGSIPESLGNLTNLTHLYLAQNSLKGEIPESFKNLEQLSVLILNNNKLSGEIPEFICNYSRLSQLWLSFNNFTGQIPVNLGKLTRLKILQLQNNSSLGGDLSSNINNLKRLEHLSYSNTNITGEPSKELIQRLKVFDH